MRIPSLPFAFGPVKRPQQERPGSLETQAPEMIEDRLPRREIGWEVAPRTAGAQHVEDRIENGTRGSGLVACHVWTREEDGVAAFPTPRRKDCLGNWFSSIQIIIPEILCPFPKHALTDGRRVPGTAD